MNLNTNTEVTLYDFLNYEVIGGLLLLLCNIMPNTLSPSWLFFVFAFIAGLVFSKLVENAFWTKWTRNPEWAIRKGVETLNKYLNDNQQRYSYSINEYYRDYYRVSKEPSYKTILILEAQYRFICNLLTISLLCFFACLVRLSIDFENLIKVSLLITQIDAEIIVHYPSVNFSLLYFLYGILLFCDIVGLFVIDKNNMIDCELKFDPNISEDKIIYKIGRAFLLIVFFLISFCMFSGNCENKAIFLGVSVLLLLLSNKTQRKISTLVIEGAYYLKELEKEEPCQQCEKIMLLKTNKPIVARKQRRNNQ